MKSLRRYGRVQSLAVFGLVVLSTLVVPAAGATRLAPRTDNAPKQASSKIPTLEPSEAMAGLKTVTVTPTYGANKVRGELGSIELNVDSTSPDASPSVFTFGTDSVVKAAFGNRFTLTNAQAPFKLTGVSAILATLQDGTGFEAGEMVGIVVFVDPASTGSIANAHLAFSGTATLDQGNVNLGLQLPEPVVVKQGDVYVMFVDLTTDAEDTPVPVVQPENGGVTEDRSFLALSTDVPVDDATTTSPYFSIGQVNGLDGNVVVRGYGDPATAGDLVTGGGETTNPDLAPPENPMAVGSSPVTLSWSAPPSPSIDETEPNNSASAAQEVPFNTIINATTKVSDPGTDVGDGTAQDWFSFTLDSASTISVDLVDDGGIDIDLYLYRKSGPFTSLGSSANDCGAHEVISDVALDPGEYVVAVVTFDNPGCPAPSSTPYQLLVVGPGGALRTGYNVYCGSSPNFEPSAETYIGTVGSASSSLVIQESAVGAYYRVTAVYGDEMSNPTDAVSGTPCEGGPTFGMVKVKLAGQGTITLKNGVGDLTGAVLTINGVGFTKAPKIKTNKNQIKQKGPLANGQTVRDVCENGCTITVMTNSGCSQVSAP